MNSTGYTIIVEPLSTPEGGGFLATVPDLPGCMGDGETVDEATANVIAAIPEWIAEAERLGRPAPGSAFGQWRQRVPRSLHHKLKLIAEAEGVSLNQLVAVALADYAARRDGSAEQDRPGDVLRALWQGTETDLDGVELPRDRSKQ